MNEEQAMNCASCRATETPQWRKGRGKTLCNACGVRFSRKGRFKYSTPPTRKTNEQSMTGVDDPPVPVVSVDPVVPVVSVVSVVSVDGWVDRWFDDRDDSVDFVEPRRVATPDVMETAIERSLSRDDDITVAIGDVDPPSDSPPRIDAAATLPMIVEWIATGDDSAFDGLVPVPDHFPHPVGGEDDVDPPPSDSVVNDESVLKEAHETFLVESLLRLVGQRAKFEACEVENRRKMQCIRTLRHENAQLVVELEELRARLEDDTDLKTNER